jgi:flavin reductase (DIM6/NTAB) family NADH-FMN oxidoreductase RutF
VPIAPAEFKTALSRWGSSVAIVTVRDPTGAPLGLTATSFASLSLDPPLVLFCLGHDSTHREAIESAAGFAVHILRQGQEALSTLFASRGADKFAGLTWRAGHHGAPLIGGCLAVLQCQTHSRFPGGDHTIVVGAVEEAEVHEGDPLLYYRGAYRRLAEGTG